MEMVRTDADIIIAAGDIGLGEQGLEWLKTLNKDVVYVAGNHEFYGREYGATLANLRSAALGSKVHFLEKETWRYNGIRFLGCTLWSSLGEEDHDQAEDFVQIVNDFRRIRYGHDELLVPTYLHLHQEARNWLLQELDKPFPGKTVVISHHAPTPWSWHENPNFLRRYAYCSDLKEIFHSFEIAAWFHGHIHSVSDYICSGARVVCNPRGYYPDSLVDEFDPGRIIEI
jgi:Icc-related predicted phosphoesterase